MKVVITSSNRNPIVTLKRDLSLNVQIFGSIAIKVLLDVSGEEPNIVNDGILGNVVTAGLEPAPCTVSQLHKLYLYVGLLMLGNFLLGQAEHDCRIRFDHEMKRGISVLTYYLLH